MALEAGAAVGASTAPGIELVRAGASSEGETTKGSADVAVAIADVELISVSEEGEEAISVLDAAAESDDICSPMAEVETDSEEDGKATKDEVISEDVTLGPAGAVPFADIPGLEGRLHPPRPAPCACASADAEPSMTKIEKNVGPLIVVKSVVSRMRRGYRNEKRE